MTQTPSSSGSSLGVGALADPVAAELARYPDNSMTARAAGAIHMVLPGAPALPPYRSMIDVQLFCLPELSNPAFTRAEALLTEAGTQSVLAICQSIDASDSGLNIMNGLKSAFGLFFGGGAAAMLDPEQQREDGALKALGLALIAQALMPGKPGDCLARVGRLPAWQSLVGYYGAIEIAMPFQAAVRMQEGRFVQDLVEEQAEAMIGRLAQGVGAADIDAARAVLAQLAPRLDQVALEAASYVDLIAQNIQGFLPLKVASKGSSLAGIAAFGADALPMYRFLGARLAAEGCLFRAHWEEFPDQIPPPEPEVTQPVGEDGGVTPTAAGDSAGVASAEASAAGAGGGTTAGGAVVAGAVAGGAVAGGAVAGRAAAGATAPPAEMSAETRQKVEALFVRATACADGIAVFEARSLDLSALTRALDGRDAQIAEEAARREAEEAARREAEEVARREAEEAARREAEEAARREAEEAARREAEEAARREAEEAARRAAEEAALLAAAEAARRAAEEAARREAAERAAEEEAARRRAEQESARPDPADPVIGTFVTSEAGRQHWLVFDGSGVFTDHPPAGLPPVDWPAHQAAGHVVGRWRRQGAAIVISMPGGQPTRVSVEVQPHALVVDGVEARRAIYDLQGRTLRGTWLPAGGGEGLRFTAEGTIHPIDTPTLVGRYALGVGAMGLAWSDGRTEHRSFFSDLRPSAESPELILLGGVVYTHTG